MERLFSVWKAEKRNRACEAGTYGTAVHAARCRKHWNEIGAAMPMPCEIHPKATIFPDIGCGGCWMAKEESGVIRSDADLPRCSACLREVDIPEEEHRFFRKYCPECRHKIHLEQTSKANRRTRAQRQAEPVVLNCRSCKTEFTVPRSESRRRFCSDQCRLDKHYLDVQAKAKSEEKRDTFDIQHRSSARGRGRKVIRVPANERYSETLWLFGEAEIESRSSAGV
jgi:DNA-directed RNA polymerase subunit RPC12/RpoP